MLEKNQAFPAPFLPPSTPPRLQSTKSLANQFKKCVKLPFQNKPSIRTFNQILDSGAYEMETFVPKVTSKKNRFIFSSIVSQ